MLRHSNWTCSRVPAVVSLLLFVSLINVCTQSLATDVPSAITGEFLSRLLYSPTEGFSGQGGVRTTFHITGGTAGNPRAVIALDNVIVRTNQHLDGDYRSDIFTASAPFRIRMSAARIETNGPLWRDGADVRVRVGRFYTNYSDWIARSIGRTGIELYGFPVGAHTLRLHYGLPDEWLAIRLDGGEYEQLAQVIALHRPAAGGDGYETDGHVHFRLGSLRGTYTSVTLAHDGSSAEGAVLTETTRRWGADQWIRGSVWATHESFAPPRARRNLAGDTVAFTPGERGGQIEVGRNKGKVSAGIRLRRTGAVKSEGTRDDWSLFFSHSDDVVYDLALDHSPGNPGHSHYYDLHVDGRTADDMARVSVRVRWSGRIEGWELNADRTVCVAEQLVELSARLAGADPGMITKIGAEWDAPNGFRMGVHYATHASDVLDPGTLDTHPAGLFVTAGVTATF